MFNFTTVVFDGTSPTFISQTLRDGTLQVQIMILRCVVADTVTSAYFDSCVLCRI